MEAANTLEFKNIESIYNKFKCSRCGKLLSVFPIYSGADVGYICGRCSKDLNNIDLTGWLQPATTYEFVAKQLKFPCCNNHIGCRDLLEWDMVVEHEDKCRGQLSCKLLDCPAEDTILTNLDFIEHLFNCHKKQYQEYPSRLTLLKTENHRICERSHVFFTQVYDRVFIVKIFTCFRGGVFNLSFSVQCVHIDHGYEHQFYKFEVELVGDKNKKKKIAKQCDETMHILKSLLSNENDDNHIRINSRTDNVLQDLFNDGDIELNICIIQKSKDDIATIEKNFNIITSWEKQKVENVINKFKIGKQLVSDSTVPLQETKLLKELECSICANYMSAPIFTNAVPGHSICKDCKKKTKYAEFAVHLLQKNASTRKN